MIKKIMMQAFMHDHEIEDYYKSEYIEDTREAKEDIICDWLGDLDRDWEDSIEDFLTSKIDYIQCGGNGIWNAPDTYLISTLTFEEESESLQEQIAELTEELKTLKKKYKIEGEE